MSKFKHLRLRTKVLVGTGVGLSAIAISGVAFAYFSSTGTGTGAASVGSATNWGVTTSTATATGYTTGLQPGVAASDETVTVNITNKGAGHQNLTAFVISVANADASAWSSATPFTSEGACTAASFTLGTNTAAGAFSMPVSQDLAPGATYTTTVPLALLDLASAQDNCQGLTTVPLYVAAS